MLSQRLRRWPNIEPTLENVQCLRESPPDNTSVGSARFGILTVIQAVCFQNNAQLRALSFHGIIDL